MSCAAADAPQNPVVAVAAIDGTDTLSAALPSGLLKEALVRYLRSCPIVLSARTRVPDNADPAGSPIPLAYYSDGAFI